MATPGFLVTTLSSFDGFQCPSDTNSNKFQCYIDTLDSRTETTNWCINNAKQFRSISQKPFYIIPWMSLKCNMRLNSSICLILLTSLTSEEPLKGHNWSTVVGDPVRQIMRARVFPSLNYAPCGRPSFSTAADWECCATQPVLHIHNEHHTDPRVTLRDAPTVLSVNRLSTFPNKSHWNKMKNTNSQFGSSFTV